MSTERFCKFYDHSKCLLNNHFCDMDCNRLSDEKPDGLGGARNKIHPWSNEEMDKALRKIDLRWE